MSIILLDGFTYALWISNQVESRRIFNCLKELVGRATKMDESSILPVSTSALENIVHLVQEDEKSAGLFQNF